MKFKLDVFIFAYTALEAKSEIGLEIFSSNTRSYLCTLVQLYINRYSMICQMLLLCCYVSCSMMCVNYELLKQ